MDKSEDIAKVAVLSIREVQIFLWDPHLDLLAFGGELIGVDVVIRRIVPLFVPERILSREDPPENRGNGATDEEAPTNYAPGDVVPWRIFGLPH